MIIQLYIAVTEPEMAPLARMINNVSEDIGNFFQDRSYGDDMESLQIGFLIVRSRPGYEKWYIPKKPRYIEFKSIKSILDGKMHEFRKHFHYEVRIYDEIQGEMLKATPSKQFSLLGSVVLDSLKNLGSLPKRLKNFDRPKFEADMKSFFEANPYLD